MSTTLTQISTQLRNMGNSMGKNIHVALYKEGTHLLSDIRDRSPIDSGFFRNNWRLSRDRFGGNGVFTGISISNNTPYAFFMEFGARKGEAPWFYPHTNKERTGKLIARNGRVWAGGLNPGHSKTVGGAITPVFSMRRINKLTKILADSIIGGLK